jgi:hypothetical protein
MQFNPSTLTVSHSFIRACISPLNPKHMSP